MEYKTAKEYANNEEYFQKFDNDLKNLTLKFLEQEYDRFNKKLPKCVSEAIISSLTFAIGGLIHSYKYPQSKMLNHIQNNLKLLLLDFKIKNIGD